ncbi:MAG: hypothetical protein FWH48_00780 [Oscillospiraceae bacterium]|nr:hypothetical protein [Oscillospiraceae bacterium]
MKNIKEYILTLDADLVGFADLAEIPAEKRGDFPYGIAIAIALNPSIIKNIFVDPVAQYMKDYGEEYESVTKRLDEICELTAQYIVACGYKAIAQTRSFVNEQREDGKTKAKVPHKTVAALSGFGWIGKNTLLITEKYGSALRLTSVLTDAPISADKSEYSCNCGDCSICIDNCPGKAIKNIMWSTKTDRDDLIDFDACRKASMLREEAVNEHAPCGICISYCPHTQRYLKMEQKIQMRKP